MTQYNDEEVEFCNYGLAITTEAMVRGGDPQYQTTVEAMIADLKSRITDSKNCEYNYMCTVQYFLLEQSQQQS